MYKPVAVKTNHVNIPTRISILLAMWPPTSSKEDKNRLKMYRMYSAVVVVSLIIMYGPGLVPSNKVKTSLSSTIESISYLALVLSSIKNTLDSAYLHSDDYHAFVNSVNHTENYVRLKFKRSQVVRSYLELFLVHVFLLILFTVDIVTWLAITNQGVVLFTFTSVWYYIGIYSVWIDMLLVHNYSGIIKGYTNQLNCTLIKLMEVELPDVNKINSVLGLINATKSSKEKHLRVINMRLAYTHICKTIESFNAIFGSRILMIFACTFLGICLIADVLTRLSTTSEDLTSQVIANVILWSIASIVSTNYNIKIEIL